MSNVIQLHKNKCGCDECDWMKDLDEYEADLISFRTDPYAEGKGHFLGLVAQIADNTTLPNACLLYTSPSPRDVEESRMPSSA